ncbi:MAG: GNAT family N-acetyltransferase [Alphaproteobacteria bacterium]
MPHLPDGQDSLVARTVERIADVPAASWDALTDGDNPFVSHTFLHCLEESGSAGPRAGWIPRHLVIEDAKGRLAAACPLYLKSHSQGEYVFDHGWAHAWERAGGTYYPKLQVAVPFSPVPGPRLLVGGGADAAALRRALASTLETLAERLDVSSVHVTFPDKADWEALGAAGWIQRVGRQFHWANAGYRDFDDFLAALSSRKRKNIRKERKAIADAGIEVRALSGTDIAPRHWDAFYRFYQDTYDRKWGHPYLTRQCFDLLQHRMGDSVVLVMAFRGERPIAGALNLKGPTALFGRNWGCAEDVPFLHFECCYYQAIDYAIAHGLQRVEAGTQGPHKIQRGYMPVETYSAHYIPDRGFRAAVARFCEAERREVEAEMALIEEEYSPFRKEDGAS